MSEAARSEAASSEATEAPPWRQAVPRRVPVIAPRLLSEVLERDTFAELEASLRAQLTAGQTSFDEVSSRHNIWESDSPTLAACLERSVPLAREVFASPTLVPSYAMFAHYAGQASLARHTDSNACTYTLDLCLYQREAWGLWVEDQRYLLGPNQALAFFGNEQLHWREPFPSPATNEVGMVFLHFVEPEHWYKHRRDDYLSLIYTLQEVLALVEDPDQRSFLRLLIKAWSPADMFTLVALEQPGCDPVDWVFAQLERMCQPGGPLGISMSPATLRVARSLAEGWPLERIARDLNAPRTTPVALETVAGVCNDLRESLLTLLFTHPTPR